jgi:DNA-directed RNA polymerase specialized sigma24 family protein
MITDTVNMTMMSDDQLWQRSVAGDREAFRQIVERYPSLVCSLAYSASGNLSRSEDLAQDTFVTAGAHDQRRHSR